MYDYKGHCCIFCDEAFDISDDVTTFQGNFVHQSCLEDYIEEHFNVEEA